MRRLVIAIVLSLAAAGSLVIRACGKPPALFVSEQITPSGEYTSGIEGPAVDALGALYAMNFRSQGTIGRLSPGGSKSQPFAVLPLGGVGNGSRFHREGRMYVADYKNHNIFIFDHGSDVPKLYFHSSAFTQPNDLAMARDGTIFASDPDFHNNSGRIWRIDRGTDGSVNGAPMLSERAMGETNGLDLTPDETELYVSESDTREVWAYRIVRDKLISPRLVMKFPAFELDGLRTDLSGRLFVTRPGNGTVAVISPDGKLLREVALKGKDPTNLTFGGPDGKTVFVTQKDGRFIEAFRVDVRGREPCFSASPIC